MKRNKKEEKWREACRLYKYYNDLDTKLIWVPVEEPRFLGWELEIVLGDSGSRRRDAEELLQVMKIAKVSDVTFTRFERIPKLVKANGGNYLRSVEAFKQSYRKRGCLDWENYITQYMPYFWHKKLDERTFTNLTPNIQKYFSEFVEPETYWRPSYKYYKLLTWFNKFPFYELSLKVTKAYSTHRGIPQSFNQSEHDKLHDKFSNDCFWNKYYDRRHGDTTGEVRRLRKRWKQNNRVLVNLLDEADNYELIEKYQSKQAFRARTPWD